jgi:hypothetical protein
MGHASWLKTNNPIPTNGASTLMTSTAEKKPFCLRGRGAARRPRSSNPELRGGSHRPELALATRPQFATAPWHELAVKSGRRACRDRSTSLAVYTFQLQWSASRNSSCVSPRRSTVFADTSLPSPARQSSERASHSELGGAQHRSWAGPTYRANDLTSTICARRNLRRERIATIEAIEQAIEQLGNGNCKPEQ